MPGKSTFTAALVGRGWTALGDDKVLLRLDRQGAPEAAALLHTFNLHPGTRRWLPEVGDLERLPVYSAWTEKRRVALTAIWPGAAARRATPARLVALERAEDHEAVEARPMPEAGVLSTLLRQTVVPADPAEARSILAVVAGAARRLEGVHLSVGREAWADPATVERIEQVVG